MISREEVTSGGAVAWYTEDHLTDKSATTHDKTVAERWLAKGWPVTALYAASPTTVSVERSWLKQVHRDLDACQKVIWLGLRGADPSYCADAQARLKEIDALLRGSV